VQPDYKQLTFTLANYFLFLTADEATDKPDFATITASVIAYFQETSEKQEVKLFRKT
jgi:hypothetical protein